jgi:VanZ family protein
LTIHTALRKLGHLMAYAVLAALLWRAFRGQAAFLLKAWAPIILAFVLAVIYATLDEFHQSFVPSRTASARDVAIDIGGAMIGLAICWAFGLRRKPQIVY